MSELVRPFPSVGGRMHQAYADLARLEQAKDPSTVKSLGPVEFIPRPWDVAGITDRDLRLEVWEWLDRCVDWLNTEYAWQLGDIVPSCWPRHPARDRTCHGPLAHDSALRWDAPRDDSPKSRPSSRCEPLLW